jgi:hypothetical protein
VGARILANQQGFLMPEINPSRILGLDFHVATSRPFNVPFAIQDHREQAFTSIGDLLSHLCAALPLDGRSKPRGYRSLLFYLRLKLQGQVECRLFI